MNQPQRGLLGALVALAWSIMLIALLLWAAVWLISQIYLWLIGFAVIVALVWLVVWWVRLRRSRW